MDDPLVSFAVSWLTIDVSKVKSENLVNSGNHHRIPGGWCLDKHMHVGTLG